MRPKDAPILPRMPLRLDQMLRQYAAVPLALQGALADVFDVPALDVSVADGDVRMGVAGTGRSGRLLPVSPNRFVSPDVDGLQAEFQRDAWGDVAGLVLKLGDARAYYLQP